MPLLLKAGWYGNYASSILLFTFYPLSFFTSELAFSMCPMVAFLSSCFAPYERDRPRV
uniref:Uncharacterized protein n=1 Tax=Rhizophora mucronata TaxID=61149 RepID=A0A2P2N5I3_RHIMU